MQVEHAIINWKFRKRSGPVRARKTHGRNGVDIWFRSVRNDLWRLLDHRGGSDRIIELYLANPQLIRRGSSVSIGEEIELTLAERQQLRISSLRPSDVTWRQCRKASKDDRNRRKREKSAIDRLAAGCRPRSQSLAQIRPWEAEGISRSTWYSRRKSGLDSFLPPPLKTPSHSNCPRLQERGFANGASPTTEPIAFPLSQPTEKEDGMRDPWPHQNSAIFDMRTTIGQGIKRIVLSSPCGSGKTTIAALIVDGALKKKKRVTFVVNRLSLIDQTVESFYSEGIRDIGVVQASHPMENWSKPVQICSVQTLTRRNLFPQSDIVIFDEIHEFYAFHRKWMDHPDFKTTIFIGLSATPGTKGLGKYFETMITVATTAELIEKGLLSPFRVFAASDPDLSGVSMVAGDYNENELSEAMQKGTLTADIISTYQRLWGKGKTLFFGVDRAHAKCVQERFIHAGVKCGYQDMDTSADERSQLKRDFHSGALEVVANVGTLTTGTDWDVRCLSLGRPTKSRELYSQIIGRALRTAHGKDWACILDHTNTTENLGYITDIVWETLDNGDPKTKEEKQAAEERKPPQPKKCDHCTFLKPAGVKTCPNCGKENTKLSSLIERDGELIEIKPGQISNVKKKPEQWTTLEKRQFLSELKAYARIKGYQPGWASNHFRTKFHQYPARDVDGVPPAAIISPGVKLWIRSRQIAYSKGRAKGDLYNRALAAE